MARKKKDEAVEAATEEVTEEVAEEVATEATEGAVPHSPPKARLILGDSLKEMKKLDTGSVNIVLTSPPYNLKNSTGNGMKASKTGQPHKGRWNKAALMHGYGDYDDNMPHEEYVAWQRECLTEMMRLLSDDGAIFYNHKWRVQGGLMQDRQDIVSGFPVRQIIIWQRSGGINFNKGYFVPTYEVIYLIAKPKFELLPKKNGHGDVWRIPQERGNDHPAPMPLALAERVMESVGGQVVLDPFMGSGTTGVAAQKFNKKFIGIERNEDYLEMAKGRLDKDSLF